MISWRMPGRSPTTGFTLLEIVIVLLILSFFLAPVTMNFTELRRQTYDAKNLVTATTLGVRLLEQIKAHVARLLRAGMPPAKGLEFPASFTAPLKEGGTVFTPTPFFENLMEDGKCVGKKVTVMVEWNIPGTTGKGHSISLGGILYPERN